jgi:hypothetical protein
VFVVEDPHVGGVVEGLVHPRRLGRDEVGGRAAPHGVAAMCRQSRDGVAVLGLGSCRQQRAEPLDHCVPGDPLAHAEVVFGGHAPDLAAPLSGRAGVGDEPDDAIGAGCHRSRHRAERDGGGLGHRAGGEGEPVIQHPGVQEGCTVNVLEVLHHDGGNGRRAHRVGLAVQPCPYGPAELRDGALVFRHLLGDRSCRTLPLVRPQRSAHVQDDPRPGDAAAPRMDVLTPLDRNAHRLDHGTAT